MEKSWLNVLIILLCVVSSCFSQNDEYSRALPFCRSKNEVKTRGHNRSLVIVSTLDGLVSAINARDGQVVWSFLTGPDTMLSSTISDVKMSSNGKWVRLIPALDGSLYKFDGTVVEALPISADSLLRSSLKLADDLVMSGCSENRVYGIDFENGKLKYVCNATGCQNYASVDSDDAVIVIKRRTHVVRAVDPRTGLEKWNYSVGQHEIAYIESSSFSCGSSNEFDDVIESDDDNEEDNFFNDLNVKFITTEGLVIGVKESDPKTIFWQQRFNSPVIDAWSLHHSNLEQMDLLSTVHLPPFHKDLNHMDLSAMFFIGNHNDQPYIRHSKSMFTKINQATHNQNDLIVFPKIQWKPYIITALTLTPVIVGKDDVDTHMLTYLPNAGVESTAVMIRQDGEYPYAGGYYIFPDETPISEIITSPNNSNGEEKGIFPENAHELLLYWKEVSIFILISIVLNFFLTRYFWKRRFRKENNCIESNNNNNSNQLKINILSFSNIGLAPIIQNISPDSPQRSISLNETSPSGEFTSRYLNDFDPIQCLGRGGFGVVFQARNKIDDCDYAIKRICLPNREEAREKVMREVKALAKLDHIGIVRYYNAWVESPPAGWQENMDKLWEQKGLMMSSTCVTSEYSTDSSLNRKNSDVNPLHPFGDSFLDNERDLLSFHNKTSSLGFSVKNWCESKAVSPEKTMYEKISPFQKSINNWSSDNEDDVSVEHNTVPSSFVPFENYKEKSVDLSSDSFIVFEDSGCGDYKNNNVENNNSAFNVEQRNGDVTNLSQEATSDENERISKSARLFRPNSLTSTSRSSVKKQNIPRMYLHIQTQLCKKENLKDWLANNLGPRDKFQVLDFFDQIVCAVEYVHSQGLMHRDLKPSNIFFAMDDTIKVGDFGLVATMTDGVHEHTPSGDGPNRTHTDQVGTQLYMSPEQVAGLVYSHKVDIFSLGLIFFELITPFNTQMERLRVLLDVKKQIFPKAFLEDHPDECAFVKQMLLHDPELRPSASDIRQHSLLHEFQPPPEMLRLRHSRTLSRTRSISSSSGSGSGSFSFE